MHTRTILLVEDNPDDERLTLRALAKVHPTVTVHVERDGQLALDRLFENPDTYAMVLLDLKLPKLSGIEVLQRLRANPATAHQVVVMLTSSDEPSDVKSCYAHHANSYIRKPVDFDQFSNVVQQLGMYWMATNVGP
jgi:CheY-like chemotaxis protein